MASNDVDLNGLMRFARSNFLSDSVEFARFYSTNDNDYVVILDGIDSPPPPLLARAIKSAVKEVSIDTFENSKTISRSDYLKPDGILAFVPEDNSGVEECSSENTRVHVSSTGSCKKRNRDGNGLLDCSRFDDDFAYEAPHSQYTQHPPSYCSSSSFIKARATSDLAEDFYGRMKEESECRKVPSHVENEFKQDISAEFRRDSQPSVVDELQESDALNVATGTELFDVFPDEVSIETTMNLADNTPKMVPGLETFTGNVSETAAIPPMTHIAPMTTIAHSEVEMVDEAASKNNSKNDQARLRTNSVDITSVVDEADPLLLSSWPSFVWERHHLPWPLPAPAVIATSVREQGHIVYWVQHTIRVEHNIGLQMAALLARKLCLPLLLVAIVDDGVVSDMESVYQEGINASVPPSKTSSPACFIPHRSPASMSFMRKSMTRLASLVDMRNSLQQVQVLQHDKLGTLPDTSLPLGDVSFLCLTRTGLQRDSSSATSIPYPLPQSTANEESSSRSRDRSALVSDEAYILSNLASALPNKMTCLFTDDSIHPMQEIVLQSLGSCVFENPDGQPYTDMRRSVPCIAIDSNSIILPRRYMSYHRGADQPGETKEEQGAERDWHVEKKFFEEQFESALLKMINQRDQAMKLWSFFSFSSYVTPNDGISATAVERTGASATSLIGALQQRGVGTLSWERIDAAASKYFVTRSTVASSSAAMAKDELIFSNALFSPSSQPGESIAKKRLSLVGDLLHNATTALGSGSCVASNNSNSDDEKGKDGHVNDFTADCDRLKRPKAEQVEQMSRSIPSGDFVVERASSERISLTVSQLLSWDKTASGGGLTVIIQDILNGRVSALSAFGVIALHVHSSGPVSIVTKELKASLLEADLVKYFCHVCGAQMTHRALERMKLATAESEKPGNVLSQAINLIPWFDLIPASSLVQLARYDTVSASAVVGDRNAGLQRNIHQNSGCSNGNNISALAISRGVTANPYNFLYPSRVRNGDTDDDFFNAVQRCLLLCGVFPRGLSLQYWIAFLMTKLITPEMGIKTCITELASHLSTFVEYDAVAVPLLVYTMSVYVIPLLFDIAEQRMRAQSAACGSTDDHDDDIENVVNVRADGVGRGGSTGHHSSGAVPGDKHEDVLALLSQRLRQAVGDFLVDRFIVDHSKVVSKNKE